MLHLFERGRELGPLGLLRRVWVRAVGWMMLLLQSLWWGWMSRRAMSDSSFLARIVGQWRSMDEFLTHLAERPASSFMLPHDLSEETARLLRHHYPKYVSNVLSTADAICRNEISLFGRVSHFQDEIDWHCDPVTGFRWPLLYRGRMNEFVGSARPVDLIHFWELNRHQHFISLGIAYWLTGEERYVNTFIAQVQSWIRTNPLMHGMNWYYPLEVSIRLLAWVTAFQFFRNAPQFQQRAAKDFMKSLWQQLDFLSRHLQPVRAKDVVSNNHLMAELTGLILTAAAFPEFRDSANWRESSLLLLVQQAKRQTHPDGVNKEQASGYHRFVAELLLLVTARSYQGGLKREPVIANILEQMLDFVLFTIAPTGVHPMWGDTDFGRALGLGLQKDFWDFRPLLSAGAVIFDRADWKFAAGCFDEEAFWLLGSEGLAHWEQLETHQPEQTSRAFPYGGHYIIRDSWTDESDAAVFRCGVFGLGGNGHCAHAHSDLLSFMLWGNGQPLLVDAGTYMYHGALRDYFRLTPAHNTVTVDGRDQAVPKPNFNWRRISDARCVDWSENQVTGAIQFGEVEFIRTLHHPCPGIWTLNDKFVGFGEHKLEWFFNFAPGLDVELFEKDNALKVFKEGLPFLVMYMPEKLLHVQMINAWYSCEYGVRQSIQRMCAQWMGGLKEDGEDFHWRFELVGAERVSSRGEYAAVA